MRGAAFACAAGLLSAAACLGAPVRLDIPVFDGGYGIGFYQETARKFEALHPGVTVDVHGSPRVQDQLRVRIIDGNYPDAAWVPYILWPALIRSGKIFDLGPFLAGRNFEGDAVWADTFQPGALDSWRVGKGVYGLPFSYACWSLFYDRDMFRSHGWREPATWDEFFSLCDHIRAAGLSPVSVPGTRWLYPAAFFRAAFHNLAGPGPWAAMTSNRPGAWTDPRLVRAAGLLQRVAREDLQPGWEGETATGAEIYFLEGKAAMTVSGSWFFNEMRGKIPAGMDIGTMNFPVFAEGLADPTTIQTGSDCFFAFRTGNRAREETTIEFLKFLTSRQTATAFVRYADAPVAVRGVPASAYSERMRGTADLISSARDSFNMPQTELQTPEVRQALVDSTRLLMAGVMTPEGFSQRLEAAAAADRARERDPFYVDYRHGAAGCALLACLVLAAAWAGRDRLLSWRKPSQRPTADFGRLRAGPAAAFLGPAFTLYGALVLVPAVGAFLLSFTRWDGIGARSWAGLYNFRSLLFGNDVIWTALGNNLYLVVVPAMAVIPLSLILAALLHRGAWGAGAFRAIVLFPNLLGAIAATLIWLAAYQPHNGLVNTSLSAAGHALHWGWLASFADYPWLSDRHLYAALVPIYIWMACGFNVVLYLAAMEGIDPQLYEAADIDGAPGWRQFLAITLPMIRGIVAISAVFLVIGGLNAFEMVWLLTSQDPSAAVSTLGTLLVTTMFKDFDIGGAAALAVILFALVLAGSAVMLRLFGSEPEES